MREEIRPTGITYEDAMDAAQRGGSIDFEGRKARVVHLSQKSGIAPPHSARIQLDLGDRYPAHVGEEGASEEFSGGAICEWASAPPAIALVAKTGGSLRVSSPAGNLPSTGDGVAGLKVHPYARYKPSI